MAVVEIRDTFFRLEEGLHDDPFYLRVRIASITTGEFVGRLHRRDLLIL